MNFIFIACRRFKYRVDNFYWAGELNTLLSVYDVYIKKYYSALVILLLLVNQLGLRAIFVVTELKNMTDENSTEKQPDYISATVDLPNAFIL